MRRSVTRLPSGRWRGRYFDSTTQLWKSVGSFRTKSEAQGALDNVKPSAVPALRSDMTFDVFAQTKFFPFEDLARTTAANQPSIYKHYVLPRWGAVLLADITVEDVEQWARVELPATRSSRNRDRLIGDSMRKQAYWIFHKIIAKAIERGYIAASPLPRKSGIKKNQPRKPERILTPDQVELLAMAADPWSTAIFCLAYGGFRIGELFALRLNDVDFDRCQIIVDEKVVEVDGQLVYENDLKRARSQRRVPVPQVVIEMLAAVSMRHEDTQLLFGRVYPSNWRRRVFAKAVRAASLPRMTPHDLRHTAASAWFDEGFDLVEVARMLGDSLDVAEETYVHIYQGRRQERMAAMDDRLKRGRIATSNVVQLRRVQ